MSKKLQMAFTLDTGKTLTYSLSDPKDGLTMAEVQAVMNNMIAKQAVVSANGTATAIKEALIKSTEEIALA